MDGVEIRDVDSNLSSLFAVASNVRTARFFGAEVAALGLVSSEESVSKREQEKWKQLIHPHVITSYLGMYCIH